MSEQLLARAKELDRLLREIVFMRPPGHTNNKMIVRMERAAMNAVEVLADFQAEVDKLRADCRSYEITMQRIAESDNHFEAEVARLTAALAAEKSRSGLMAEAWCQPMDCGKHTPRHFIVRFEDQEAGDAVFTDEREAYEYFERANGMGWNCWLFGAMPLPARDALSTLKGSTDDKA